MRRKIMEAETNQDYLTLEQKFKANKQKLQHSSKNYIE